VIGFGSSRDDAAWLDSADSALAPAGGLRMTGIGRTNSVGHGTSAGWGEKFDFFFIAIFNTLTGWLCRASRGYLCPPDMHHIMFPDEPGAAHLASSNSPLKECCDEKLRRK
jgi:hypothetical protein